MQRKIKINCLTWIVAVCASIELLLATCPLYNPDNSMCYWPSNVSTSIIDHRRKCAEDDGSLLTITSPEVDNFINKSVPWSEWFTSSNKDLLLGVYDVFEDRNFYEIGVLANLQNNLAGFPSNGNTDGKDCSTLSISGTITLRSCSDSFKALCSKANESSDGCPVLPETVAINNQCFWPLTDDYSAGDHMINCSTYNGSLAVLDSDQRVNDVVDKFSFWNFGASDEVWVGINDIDEEGTFRETYFIKNPVYFNWAPNEPGASERCVERWYNGGKLNDLSCSTQSRFSICQRRDFSETITTDAPSTTTTTPTIPQTTVHSTLHTSTGSSDGSTTFSSQTQTSTHPSTQPPSQTSTHTSTQHSGSTSTQPSTLASTHRTTAPTSCPCLCQRNTTNVTISDAEIKKKVEEIRNILILPKNLTSKYQRSKTSAYESRPTAKGLGSLGIVVIGGILAFLVILDVSTAIGRKTR